MTVTMTRPVEFAITVRPPWSWVIAESAALEALGLEPKLVENRGRAVPARYVGHDIAIHAARAWDEFGICDQRVMRAWRTFMHAVDPREPNPKLAAIGDTRTGHVEALSPTNERWVPSGAVVAVATLVDCHTAFVPCPECGAEAKTVQDTYRWTCVRCAWNESALRVKGCCQPWGEAVHSGRAARHLVFDNVRRLDDPVPAAGSQLVPWKLDQITADGVATALAKAA